MGNYNPSAPLILGEEWVGIREEVSQFSPTVNTQEQGHGFTLATSRTLQDARFYVNEMPASVATMIFVASVYSRETQDLSGPIQRIVIPVSTVQSTGVTFSGAPTNSANALLTPDQSKYILLDPAPAVSGVRLQYSVNNHSQMLNGKRILGVNHLFAALRAFNSQDPALGPLGTYETDTASSGFIQLGNFIPDTTVNPTSDTLRVRFGDTNILGSGLNFNEQLPWTFADLLRFDPVTAAASRIYVTMRTGQNFGPGPASGAILFWYSALEVLFCEEQRIAVGGRKLASGASAISYGTNVVTMRTWPARALSPVLNAGNYYLTVASADRGDFQSQLVGYPDLNALRELDAISTHPGVKINLPFPPEDHVGETLTEERIHVLPQLSLHTSAGPLTEVHSYGRQAKAPVYASLTAMQHINDDLVPSATYQQVRFYARRFGDTTIPLTLDSTTIVGPTITLTPSEWDALPEIVDGWKEITKTFSSPPTMGGLSPNPRWRFSATGETAGNRWEVLGLTAPAVTSVAGDINNPVAAPHQLSTATYGTPNSGDTVLLNWSSPFISGLADDATSDAVLIFSQDPPTLTGFTASNQSQSLTAFSECGAGPCCIPTALSYIRLTWSATAATGMSYELQRWDANTDWQTIMLATNPAITGFNDYEARVGIPSVYRIRARNVLDFNGQWSVQVTGTVNAPGVTMPSCGTNKRGVLLFTSNASQSGAYNLAYAMTWDGAAQEDFSFAEAGGVSISQQLDRDYQVATHGSERGGEIFNRTLLIANAAVATPRLANVMSLRNMAWADLPYVCVRDDIGDRWLASVIVPSDVVKRNRRLYNAQVTIIEVTGTANPVNP